MGIVPGINVLVRLAIIAMVGFKFRVVARKFAADID